MIYLFNFIIISWIIYDVNSSTIGRTPVQLENR